jgi:pSer/pThr/pTyr-binding forkhead associated (FHA) protein
MKVRLKILHGTLQDTHGHRTGLEVKVRGPQFVIGSATDCSMCCRSDSVLPHHSEILFDQQQAVIRPLSGKAGTFINGQRVEHEQILQAGDHLRIGRLEFEVLIEETPPAAAPPLEPELESDSAGEEISDLLAQADERERLVRQEHPELRVLHLESAGGKPAKTAAEEAVAAEQAVKPKKKGRKKPGKLAVRPPKDEIHGEDSTEAAQEALRKLFSR